MKSLVIEWCDRRYNTVIQQRGRAQNRKQNGRGKRPKTKDQKMQ